MIQLDFRIRSGVGQKNPTPTPTPIVLRYPTPIPPKNLRSLVTSTPTPTPQPWLIESRSPSMPWKKKHKIVGELQHNLLMFDFKTFCCFRFMAEFATNTCTLQGTPVGYMLSDSILNYCLCFARFDLPLSSRSWECWSSQSDVYLLGQHLISVHACFSVESFK